MQLVYHIILYCHITYYLILTTNYIIELLKQNFIYIHRLTDQVVASGDVKLGNGVGASSKQL